MDPGEPDGTKGDHAAWVLLAATFTVGVVTGLLALPDAIARVAFGSTLVAFAIGFLAFQLA